jgi:hypothetical protein
VTEMSESIRLGSHEWPLRPLTARQIQQIEPILMSSDCNVLAALKIISVALLRDHSDAASSLGDIEMTAPEIGAALEAVLRLGGFIGAECTENGAAAADASEDEKGR